MNLTARSYLFVGVVCLLGILGQWWGEPLDKYWLILTLVLLAALLIERSLARRLTLNSVRRVKPRGYLGRPLRGTIHMHNDSPQTVSCLSEDDYPAGLPGTRETRHWRVEPDSTLEQQFSITPQRLGQFQWHDLYARTLGYFRLAWWPRRLAAQGRLEVVPDRLHANEARGGTQEQGELERRITGAGHELLGLRDYRPGDPLRAIDWKASARSQRPTVRVFSQEQHLELVIAVDIGRHSTQQAGMLTRLNHYINIAARLAEKAVHNGDQVALTVYADKPSEVATGIKTIPDLVRMRASLAQLHAVPVESNPLVAVQQMRSRARQRSMMVLLTDLDIADADGQLCKAVSLLTPKHLPVIASIIDEEIQAMELAHATSWLDPYYTLAAMETGIATRRLALQIRRMGGHVVQARPAMLDNAVMRYYEQLRRQRRV